MTSKISARVIERVLFAALAMVMVTCSPRGAVSPPTPPPVVSPPTGEAGGHPVYKDQLGVLFIPGSTPQQWKDALDRFGLPMIGQHGPRLATFALGADTELREIVRRGSELARSDQIVALAGFVQLIDEGSGEIRVVPNQILVEFEPNTPPAVITAAIAGVGATTLSQSPYVPNQFLIALPDTTSLDPFEACRQLETSGARIAEPNYVLDMQDRETIPTDEFFGEQWHHRNTGTVPDADIDTTLAWDLLTEVTDWPLVAVIEGGGFDVSHPDYVANVAPGMWDFRDCDANPGPDCGDAEPGAGAHGTSTAGAVAAEGDGARGVVGVCPRCRLLLLQAGGGMDGEIRAFDYAREQGAAVVSNSRGYRSVPGLMREAIERMTNRGRDGLGGVVTFAMSSTPSWEENCAGTSPDVSALRNVIGVSASNEFDERSFAGYGNCLDVLAPTDPAGTAGTRWAATTDTVGAAGSNPPSMPGGACTDLSNPDYTRCFGGTSFATPLVSGTAALVIAANPSFTALQVQQLLQDTADKVDTANAAYNPFTGFSEPTIAPRPELPVGSTHAYGRINAFEAVKVVAPTSVGGGNGVDVFMRDNRLDWGNTEQPSNVLMDAPRAWIPHYESVDIKVDAPDFEATPPTAQTFDAFPDEPALGGQTNRVYVRVRNRGPRLAEDVRVLLYWANAAAGLPPVSENFWSEFPRNVGGPDWHFVIPEGTRPSLDIPYSGASIAADREYGAQIVQFNFEAPVVEGSDPAERHHCLMAIAFSDQDPIPASTRASRVVDHFAPRDNNITQKNIQVLRHRGESMTGAMTMNNPTDSEMETRLVATVPNGFTVTFEPAYVASPFVLDAGRSVDVRVHIHRPAGTPGQVRVFQERIGTEPLYLRVVGGNTYRFE